MERTGVTAHLNSMAEENPAAQRQTAVTALLKRKLLLLFVFARRSACQYSMAEDNPAAERQTAVTAYLKKKQQCISVYCRSSHNRLFAMLRHPTVTAHPDVSPALRSLISRTSF